MRKFEIISEAQWVEDINMKYAEGDFPSIPVDIKHHLKPRRGTKYSAGYDFYSPVEIFVPAHGTAKIPTGIKARMNKDEVLKIFPRSSIGFKTNIRLANTIGVVDCDYYNNPNNEGHIFVKLYNPTDSDFHINVGDKFAQGIFEKYLIVDDEEDIEEERSGGIGSTGK